MVAGPRTAGPSGIPYPPYRSRPGLPPHQLQQQLSQQQQQMMSKMGGQHYQSLQQQQQLSLLQFQQQQQQQQLQGPGSDNRMSPNMGFTGQQGRPNSGGRTGQQEQQLQVTEGPPPPITQPVVTPTPELRQQIQQDAQTAAAIVALKNAQVSVKTQQQLNAQNQLKLQQVVLLPRSVRFEEN